MKQYILSIIMLMAAALLFIACNDDSFVDPRDGQKYKTVKIGNQIWMAENLNYEMGYSWCYELNEDNCKEYGRLYIWDVALNACPDGWHLPSEVELDFLMAAVGGRETAGKKLKSKTGWTPKENANGNGVDQYGFSAKPSGGRNSPPYGEFYGIKEKTVFWSSEDGGPWKASVVVLESDADNITKDSYWKNFALSVRCIKGEVSSKKEENKEKIVSVPLHEMTDSRDGQKYKTVRIGNQVWTAENMNYKTEKSSECNFYDEEKCKKYGRTYTYKDALNVCPDGWHLPTYNEFYALIQNVGGKNVAGKALKSSVDWTEKTQRMDEYGFSALPIDGYYEGDECGFSLYSIFWSSTEDSSGSPYGLYICNDWDPAKISWAYKDYRFAVRCIKDEIEFMED